MWQVVLLQGVGRIERRWGGGGGGGGGCQHTTRNQEKKKTDDFSFFFSAGAVATGGKPKLAVPVCTGTGYGTNKTIPGNMFVPFTVLK